MGNSSSECHVTNYSKRTVRVIVTQHSLEIADVLVSESHSAEHSASEKRFTFRKDVNHVRILPSQCVGVKYEPQEYMNIFVEDDDEKDVCFKHIMHNTVKSAAFALLLYDV